MIIHLYDIEVLAWGTFWLTDYGIQFSCIGYLNTAKKDNAHIVLSDSVALQDARVNFKDLSGFLGNALSALREARRKGKDPNSADEIMDGVVCGMVQSQNSELPSFLLSRVKSQVTINANHEGDNTGTSDDDLGGWSLNSSPSVEEEETPLQVYSRSEESYGWLCRDCTFFNTNGADACQMCSASTWN